MKLTENSRNYLILFVTTFLVTLIYFSPFLISALRGYKPELRFVGDLQLVGYPAFIQTGNYFANWIFSGIDFFTANGSSSLFLRPNLTIYYLPQLLLQTIFSISNNELAAKMFMFQMWIGGFIAMLFTSLWLNRIAKIDIYFSLVGGALFFSIVSYTYSQIAFFYVACTFPVLLYCLSVAFTKKTDIYQKILLSIPFIMIITAGYLPIAVMGVAVAVVGALAIGKYYIEDGEQRYKDFLMVLGFGLLVSSGYLLTTILAVKNVTGMPKAPLLESMFFSDLSLTFKGVMTIFLASVPNDAGEAPHFRLGLPILILLYVSCCHLFLHADAKKKNTFVACIILFLLSILLSMGTVSGLADIFFYMVPGLGSMHVYARYMLIIVFFLVFALTLALSELYLSDKPLNLKLPSIAIALTLIAILFFPEIFTKHGISLPILSGELLISILVLFALHLRGNKQCSLILLPILIFSQGAFMYMQENWITLSNTGNAYKDIVNSEDRTNNLTNYFYNNTDKLFIKYIDITPEIEKHGGVPHNFPWFIRYAPNETRRISSYMGYDQGLSQQFIYARKMSYFSKYDKNYLMESGIDYILYDRKTQAKEATWLKTIVDLKVPEHDIGNGFFAAKVLQQPLRLKDEGSSQFDNGVFKIMSDDENLKVESFQTNWSTKTMLDFNTSKSGILHFELFPHKYLKFYLNGVRVQPTYSKVGLASFSFPAGKNQFMVVFSNYPQMFFLYTYSLYLLIIFFILIRYVWLMIRGRIF